MAWALAPVLGLGATVIAILGLAASWSGKDPLAARLGVSATVTPLTAAMVALAGLALAFAGGRNPSRSMKLASRVLGLVAAGLGAAVLAEYFAATNLGIDVLFGQGSDSTPHPGRPSPYTALSIVCLGFSITFLRQYGVVRRNWGWASPMLASIAVALGAMASIGYAEYLRLPNAGGPSMSPLTAAALGLCGIGVLVLAALRSRAVLEGDGAPGAWVPAWIGGPVAAVVFAGTLVAWVTIMHLQPAARAAAPSDIDIPTASVTIVIIAAALGLMSGVAAALLAGSRFQVRRTRVWAESLAGAQVRLRALFQQAAVGIELLGTDGRILEVNDKFCEILGGTRQALLGRNFRDLTHSEDLPNEDRLLARLLDRHVPSYAVEKRYLRLSGGEVWVRVTSSLALDRQGRAMYRISIVEDISARKRAEEALRESEGRKSAMLQSAMDGVVSTDEEERIIEFNPAAERIFGYSRDRVLGRSLSELFIPQRLRTDHREWMARVRAGGEELRSGARLETPALRADGTEFIAEVSVTPTRLHSRNVVLTAFVRDITDRLRSEAASAQLAAIVASSDDAIMSVSLDGRIKTFNAAAERLYGYTAAEVMGYPVTMLIPPERHKEEESILAQVRAGNSVQRHETVRLTKDKRLIDVSLTVSPMRDGAGRIIGASKIAHDITERLRDQAAKAQLAAIVASSEDAIISKDLNGQIQSFNAAAERMFGYPAREAVGKSIRMLIPHDRQSEEDHILGKIRRGEPVEHYETVRRTKDGRLIDVSLTVSPLRDGSGRVVGASKIARDITSKKRVEEELRFYREDLERQVQVRTADLERSQDRLRSAERLAALGTLSAGLGHDMGNLLLPVRMRLEALDHENLPPHVKDDLKAIAASAVYLQRLASSLRMFAMDPGEDGGPNSRAGSEGAELNQWWRDTEPLLRAALPRGVFLETGPGQGAAPFPSVRAAMAPQRLMQAVFNLVQNAAEAIHESGQAKGWVRISAEVAEADQRVRLSVEDNGPGMPPEVLRRCMEPFFSTKTRRISTGMGLSMVRGFVEQVGGRVEVSSEVGHGTTFVLNLPLVASPSPGGTPARPRCRAVVSLPDSRARALVEWSLRSLGAEVKPLESAEPPPVGEADLWVVDPAAISSDAIARFTQESNGTGKQAVVCWMEPPAGETRMNSGRVLYTGRSPSPTSIRRTLEEAVAATCPG
jgi:PAS domain S-box-containing protein